MTPDADLVKRSLVDPRCFEELVALHGARIHSYLFRRAPDAADDLMSEVWVGAFAGRHRYDPELGAVVSWLFGIAHNVLLAHHRRQSRQFELARLGIEARWDEWTANTTRSMDCCGGGSGGRCDMSPTGS